MQQRKFLLTVLQQPLYTNLSSDHLIFWSSLSGNYKILSGAFHFRDLQALRADTVFAAESRIKSKHLSSSGDSLVSPYSSQDSRASWTGYILFAVSSKPSLSTVITFLSRRHPHVLSLTFCLCNSLYPAEGDRCCLVLHLAEITDAWPKIIHPLFRVDDTATETLPWSFLGVMFL